MMKRRVSVRPRHNPQKTIEWLPIDSRLFPFIGFSHVKGLALVFLVIEMVLSVTVVIGSFLLAILRIFR